MLIVFFNIRGIVHLEFATKGQTVNAEFYCSVLHRLREDIRQKQPEMWHAGNWLFHDNASAHRVLVTCEFLAHNSIITLPHLPYSPDLAPCDFFLFPKMKLKLKGRCCDRVEEIQRESQNALGTLQEQDLQHTFQQWQQRWDRCVTERDAAQT
jgi:histone-lysine N-methyltransferase SETMAR